MASEFRNHNLRYAIDFDVLPNLGGGAYRDDVPKFKS